MARRFLRTLPRRTLQVVGAVLVLGVLAFFALTRTDVGRRQLKQQIEAHFDARFAGDLEIGRLTGNLVGTVYARDVTVRAPGGRAVLSVDSVRAAPRWRALLERRVSFREVELIGPRIDLVRSGAGSDGTGGWNVARAFRRRAPREATGREATGRASPFALRFANVVVRGGRLRTRNRGAVPRPVRKGWLFDYADARLTDVDARLSFERPARDSSLQIDLHRLRGRMAGLGLTLQRAQGQLTVSDDAVALRPLRLQLGQTRLRGSFAFKKRAGGPPSLRVDLKKSRLVHDEIRRLVPRWPLRATTTATLDARGPLDDLTIRRARVARGESVLRASGSVRGLPDDLVFDVQFEESRLAAADLRAVLPGIPQQQTARLARLGTARFSLETEGRVAGLSSGTERSLRASTRFDVQTTRAGALHGTADVSRAGRGEPLAYSAEVNAKDFEADRLGENTALANRLTGTLTLEGEGTSAEVLAGNLEARLEHSTVAGRAVEGLDVKLRAAGEGRFEGTATLRQRGGALRVNGTLDRHSGAQPAYDLTARGERFDLGALLDESSLRTALTGTAEVTGRGASLGALAGRLRITLDSSTVARSGSARTLAPLTSTLTLAAPGSDAPRIALRGDVADLTVTGEADPVTLRALGRLWGRAFAGAFREAYRKPYRPREATPASPPPAPPPHAWPEARAAVRRALAAAGLGDTAAFAADLALKRPALLHAFVPGFPVQHDTLAVRAGVRASAQMLSAKGTLNAAHVDAGRVSVTDAQGQFRARASLAEPLLKTLQASFDASADTLGIGGTRFRAPALAASFYQKHGDVQLSTRTVGGGGRLQLGAGLHLLPDRNRLRVRTLRLAAGDYRWQNIGAGPIDLYADAAAVRGLTLISRSGPQSRAQRVELRGALSPAPRDTLFASAENVRLGTLSHVLNLKRRLGGRLDAQVAWTGATRAPQLTGRLDVARLAIEDDLIGHLTARSRYADGASRVALEARLRPGETPVADSSALTLQKNRLSARGTVALPELGKERGKQTSGSAGALDLSLDVDRADLFFFNYIFDDKIAGADGTLSGSGHVGGTFRDPRFQADFQIADGTFRVPRFGLRYGASGDVAVDEEGIKIKDARLSDPDGGSARLGGALLFNDYAYFSFDLHATLDELRVIDVTESPDLPFFGQIAASGPLRLQGPLHDASLTSTGEVRTTPESELIIPIEEEGDVRSGSESGFLIFADSTGHLPDLEKATQRENILADRPEGERTFVDGLDLDLGITAPAGSTVHLVFDPLLGDEITAVGGGDIQVLREEGDFSLFGTFDVSSGSYLFTAGQVFQRRFQIEGGTLRWDGLPANAKLDLTATYRTRASRAGLPGAGRDASGRIPLIVRLAVGGRVQQPSVDLSLTVDQNQHGFSDYSTAGLETVLNREDREDEYATSVLLTNTFLLTTDLAGRSGSGQGVSETSNRLAFNSVSQLVSSQLNRYLDEALPNLDVNLGVQGEDPQDLDVVYGAALRLLDERLLIRGEGVLNDEEGQRASNGFEGEFVVEVRLTPRVSAQAFYRREGSLLSDRALTSTTGAGLSYQTEFSTWQKLWHRLFGWLGAGSDESEPIAAE